ncbi:hypothetical protein CSE16_18675 [Solibacillus sp. R5-41]|uniref:DUF4870 domain-containing protein n=1 Tax=Solibacillus sp. R5-41 TaxID=2048654 RepID=UPI000C129360|nr:DUF4870 domain-containing protein [Solibacillus sp. R5-41]ATP41883.1 hypothetical protein CSE16_18675 [Solibacillus sp. R5-41]
MDNSKGLSAIGYLSIFFAPFIVPLLIFFVSKDTAIRSHAKRAFISQLVPFVLGILFLVIFVSSSLFVSNAFSFNESTILLTIIIFILYLLLTCAIAVWNFVQAIKVMR